MRVGADVVGRVVAETEESSELRDRGGARFIENQHWFAHQRASNETALAFSFETKVHGRSAILDSTCCKIRRAGHDRRGWSLPSNSSSRNAAGHVSMAGSLSAII